MRNLVTRLIVLAGLVASCLGFTLAQASRVVVSRAGDDELRRTAYRLRLCPDQLANARRALAAAQTRAPHVARQTPLSNLGSLLNRLDRPHAPAILSELLDQLADQATKIEDPKASWEIMSSAQQLLNALRETDPNAADELVRNWPEPKRSAPAEQYLKQMRKTLVSEQFSWLSHSDPVKAVEWLSDFEEDLRKLFRGGVDETERPQKTNAALWTATTSRPQGPEPGIERSSLAASPGIQLFTEVAAFGHGRQRSSLFPSIKQ